MSQTKAELIKGLNINASAPATALNIDSSGRVGIGTTSPTAPLTVTGNVTLNGSNPVLTVNGSGVNQTATIINDNGGSTAIKLASASIIFADDGSNERARISSGRLLVGTSTANANGGILQLTSGITFPATAVAATDVNTLDDYEEGTWTPSIGGTATYSGRSGNYVKIGKVVYLDFYIEVAVHNTGSTTLMTGAPFNCSNTTVAAGSTSYQANLATAVVSLAPQFNSSTQIRFDNRTAASDTAAQNAVFKSGTAIYGCITYLAS